eukprot:gene11790-13750_t
MCKSSLICRQGSVLVTRCPDCKTINIWHKTALIIFSFEEFSEFVQATKGLVFEDYAEYNPEGTQVVVLPSTCLDICLVFTWQQWQDFFFALHQTAYMQQVYEAFYG